MLDVKESQLTSTVLKLPRMVRFDLVCRVVRKGIYNMFNVLRGTNLGNIYRQNKK